MPPARARPLHCRTQPSRSLARSLNSRWPHTPRSCRIGGAGYRRRRRRRRTFARRRVGRRASRRRHRRRRHRRRHHRHRRTPHARTTHSQPPISLARSPAQLARSLAQLPRADQIPLARADDGSSAGRGGSSGGAREEQDRRRRRRTYAEGRSARDSSSASVRGRTPFGTPFGFWPLGAPANARCSSPPSPTCERPHSRACCSSGRYRGGGSRHTRAHAAGAESCTGAGSNAP